MCEEIRGGVGDGTRSIGVGGGGVGVALVVILGIMVLVGGGIGTRGVAGGDQDTGGMVGVGRDDSGCDTGGRIIGHGKSVDGGVGVSDTTRLRSVVAPLVATERSAVATNIIPAHTVAPLVSAVAPPVVGTIPDDEIPSAHSTLVTRKANARMDTIIFTPIPPIPFNTSNNISDLVHFASALCDAAMSLRIACDDFHPK